MARSNRKYVQAVANRVDALVDMNFTRDDIITAAAGVPVVTGSLYRSNRNDRLYDEEGMIMQLAKVTGNKEIGTDYELVKLARARKAIK